MNLLSEIIVRTGSDDGLVSLLWHVLIVGLVALIIWWLGRWAISKFSAPPAVTTIWNGLFLFVGAIVLINFLLGLGGHPFIRW